MTDPRQAEWDRRAQEETFPTPILVWDQISNQGPGDRPFFAWRRARPEEVTEDVRKKFAKKGIFLGERIQGASEGEHMYEATLTPERVSQFYFGVDRGTPPVIQSKGKRYMAALAFA
jgi:hypothetical protein